MKKLIFSSLIVLMLIVSVGVFAGSSTVATCQPSKKAPAIVAPVVPVVEDTIPAIPLPTLPSTGNNATFLFTVFIYGLAAAFIVVNGYPYIKRFSVWLMPVRMGLENLQDIIPSLKGGTPGVVIDMIQVICLGLEKIKDDPTMTKEQSQQARLDSAIEITLNMMGRKKKEELSPEQYKAMSGLIDGALKLAGVLGASKLSDGTLEKKQ